MKKMELIKKQNIKWKNAKKIVLMELIKIFLIKQIYYLLIVFLTIIVNNCKIMEHMKVMYKSNYLIVKLKKIVNVQI